MARRRGDPPHPSPDPGRVLNPSPSAEEISTAGKVVDTGALAAWAEGRISMQTWVIVARNRGLTLLLPDLARTELLALRPDATDLIDELAGHPHVLSVQLSDAERDAIETTLADRQAFDVLAAWITESCRQRGWPALSGDPGRLRRLAPDLDIDQL